MLRTLALIIMIIPASAVHAFDQAALMKAFFSVVLVRGYNDDGSLAYGSGTVVAENQVATNCHVLRKTKQAWVSQGEESYAIVSVHADPWHDLCLLNTVPMPLQPTPLGKSADAQRGEIVIAIGHTSGVPTPQTSRGTVKSLYPFENGHIVRSTARFNLGASGSGLYDDEGKLIGINTFKSPGRAAYFYSLPIEWLDELRKIKPRTKLPINEQAFWELPDDEKPFFMQVALPQLNEDWSALLEISQKWADAEPLNEEAWYGLGVAHKGLGHTDQALQMFAKALKLDPNHPDVLYQLGLMASARGDVEEVRKTQRLLDKLDVDLAAAFNEASKCASQC